MVEEGKWRGVPVWEHAGIICTGETYRDKVKLTFAKGAALADPSGLFNASLEGNTRRAIDIHEGDAIDEEALKALIRAAVALNTSTAGRKRGHDGPRSDRWCRQDRIRCLIPTSGTRAPKWRADTFSPYLNPISKYICKYHFTRHRQRACAPAPARV